MNRKFTMVWVRIFVRFGAILAYSRCQTCFAEDVDGVIAVSSKVSSDYVRAISPDGHFLTETYAFGEGGHWTSGTSDPTIDKLKFMDIATRIAGPLAGQQYLPTRDAKSTKLVIMVYWGSTLAHFGDSVAMQNLQTANANLAAEKSRANQQKLAAYAAASAKSAGLTNSQAAAQTAIQNAAIGDADNSLSGAMATAAAMNRSRDETNTQTAALLGYDDAWNESARLQGTPMEYKRHDLSNELEEGRYFVVLMAYDFQLMLKQKEHKLLWETRFSISQRRNAFDTALPAMTQYASQFFGQSTNGLWRKEVPVGNVDVGQVKSLGEVKAPEK
jgi:hypothetical protein